MDKKSELKKYPEAYKCPFCGRLLYGIAVEIKHGEIDFSRYYELNWDKDGFYYISKRTHSPFLCKMKLRKTTKKRR